MKNTLYKDYCGVNIRYIVNETVKQLLVYQIFLQTYRPQNKFNN